MKYMMYVCKKAGDLLFVREAVMIYLTIRVTPSLLMKQREAKRVTGCAYRDEPLIQDISIDCGYVENARTEMNAWYRGSMKIPKPLTNNVNKSRNITAPFQ